MQIISSLCKGLHRTNWSSIFITIGFDNPILIPKHRLCTRKLNIHADIFDRRGLECRYFQFLQIPFPFTCSYASAPLYLYIEFFKGLKGLKIRSFTWIFFSKRTCIGESYWILSANAFMRCLVSDITWSKVSVVWDYISFWSWVAHHAYWADFTRLHLIGRFLFLNLVSQWLPMIAASYLDPRILSRGRGRGPGRRTPKESEKPLNC